MTGAILPTLEGRFFKLRALVAEDAPSLQRCADDKAVWLNLFEGSVIGCISIRQDKGWLRCNAEVGYWIGRPFWQRGITSAALKLVCRWAWESVPELTRIYAPIFARNAGSQAVAESCGFEHEGIFRMSAIKAGEVIDRTQWALMRSPRATAKPPRHGWSEAFAASPDNGIRDK